MKLACPDQLPELAGETLTMTWDQIEIESVILLGSKILWRERTVREVDDRFEEIAAVLKRKCGRRLVDLVPTPRSRWLCTEIALRVFFMCSTPENLSAKTIRSVER